MKEKSDGKLSSVIALIGAHCPRLAREIEGLAARGAAVEEIRVRRYGRSSVRISGRDIPLTERAELDMSALLESVCRGSLFAHRDSIAEGYVTTDSGVRVGIIGRAGYDGALVGVRDISALVFRIPHSECSFADGMYRAWVRYGSCGALIISPPAGGKTTALFSLLRRIAKLTGTRTVLVDERCECDRDSLAEDGVDVMQGYRRADGLEIAIRTASPETVACDEIYTEGDVRAILSAHGTGVRIIASAHARDRAELERRECLLPLLRARVFGALFTVERRGGEFFFSACAL